MRKLSEESRAAFVDGNRFATTLPDAGKRVVFKLLTGEDERELPAVERAAPDKLLSAVLAYRVLEVDGVEPKAKRQFLEDLTTRDADFLVDEFDRVDSGVDTTIEIECPRVLPDAGGGAPFRQGVLPAVQGQDREAEGPERLFPDVNMETWREGLFQLCWQQHGGSGLAVTLEDACPRRSGAPSSRR